MIKAEQSLIPITTQLAQPDEESRLAKPEPAQPNPAKPKGPTPNPPPPALSEELVDSILKGRGLRGWLRAANIGRVLGLLSLYLFLDTYDVRANFGRRAADRKREQARARGRIAQFQEWSRELDRLLVDKFIRSLRFFIFHGADGSLKKGVRLAKQASWLRENLIALGPTFIKIGQALGTRADLLPLAYVKELARLQDQVPAFSTAEAYARIESELGQPLHECYPEIDSEPIASAS